MHLRLYADRAALGGTGPKHEGRVGRESARMRVRRAIEQTAEVARRPIGPRRTGPPKCEAGGGSRRVRRTASVHLMEWRDSIPCGAGNCEGGSTSWDFNQLSD